MTERSESIDQLAAALVKAQSQFPAIPKNSVNPFFHAVADAATGCWLWTGFTNRHGYGQRSRRIDGKNVTLWPHRVAYELLVGPIPDGLVIDHLCRVRNCINPDHLEPVTQAENTRRGLLGVDPGARQRNKTHCKFGHPFDEKNTYRAPGSPNQRQCRECNRERDRRRQPRQRRAA